MIIPITLFLALLFSLSLTAPILLTSNNEVAIGNLANSTDPSAPAKMSDIYALQEALNKVTCFLDRSADDLVLTSVCEKTASLKTCSYDCGNHALLNSATQTCNSANGWSDEAPSCYVRQFDICGSNADGTFGTGDVALPASMPYTLPEVASGIKPVVTAYARQVALAIGEDEHLYIWGTDEYSLMPAGTTYTPTLIHETITFTKISGNYMTLMALSTDHVPYVWGRCTYKECLQGTSTTTVSTLIPAIYPGVKKVVDVVSGVHCSALIYDDGTIFEGGYSFHGQLGSLVSSIEGRDLALPSSKIVSYEAPYYVSVIIDDANKPYLRGRNDHGQLCNGDKTDTGVYSSPFTSVVTASCNINNCAFVVEEAGVHEVYICGQAVGMGDAAITVDQDTPHKITSKFPTKIDYVEARSYNGYGIHYYGEESQDAYYVSTISEFTLCSTMPRNMVTVAYTAPAGRRISSINGGGSIFEYVTELR